MNSNNHKDRDYCRAHVIFIVSDGPDLSVWNMAGVDFVPLIWGSGSMVARSVYVSVTCLYTCILYSGMEQHGIWSWILGVGISVLSSAKHQLRLHSIGAGPSEDLLKGLCIGASLHTFTSHTYSDIDIVNVNHIILWRRQMVFPKEVRRCWALMSQTSQISIDPSFWIATLLTISCSLTAWLLRANLDPETATTSDWSKNSWRWIVPNSSSSDHLCSLISVPKWDAWGCPALEGCGSTGGGEQHLHYCRALGAVTGTSVDMNKKINIWNNLSCISPMQRKLI